MVTIKTERLTLRPYKTSDWKDLHTLMQDKRVHKYLIGPPWPYTEKDAKEWVKSNSPQSHRRKNWVRRTWGIFLGNEQVGNIGLHEFKGHRVEMGYWMRRKLWGKGLMPEAARAVMKYAFTVLGVKRVQARADLRNTASQRVMEKIGMQREGILKKYDSKNGKCADAVYYAMVR